MPNGIHEPPANIRLREIGRRLERLEHHADLTDERYATLESRVAQIESDVAVIKSNYVRREDLAIAKAEILEVIAGMDQRHNADIKAMTERYSAEMKAMAEKFGAEMRAMAEKHSADIKMVLEKIDSVQIRVYGVIFGLSLSFLGVLAKGFGWL